MSSMQLLHRLFLVVLFCLPGSSSVAQMRGTFGVGVGIGMVIPASPELKTDPSIRPSVHRVPKKGWGFSLAYNSFEAEVDAGLVDGEGRLGRIVVRPLMLGLGYTSLRGRISVTPSFVAGPALNTVTIENAARDRYEVTGSTFDKKVGTVSVAIRAGVSATYAAAPRIGLAVFGGYIWNRPTIAVSTPGGEVNRRWRTDGISLSTGVILVLS